MRPKDLRVNLAVAPAAELRVKPARAEAKPLVTTVAQKIALQQPIRVPLVRCTAPCALNVARKRKFLSNLLTVALFIAPTVTAPTTAALHVLVALVATAITTAVLALLVLTTIILRRLLLLTQTSICPA